jgi:RNA polymerase sigma-70 factor (ECF subfamily)
VEEGVRLLNRALRMRRPGPYQVQAAIAALHAQAASASDTDWDQIAELYGALFELSPTPVVALNRAVAVAETGRVGEGLAMIDVLAGLDGYHLMHAARADLLRRLGRLDEARAAYSRALALTRNSAEQEFLVGRLAEVGG